MFITVLSARAVSGGHVDYMAYSELSEQEGKVRPLFTSSEDNLSRREANNYLSNDEGRPQDGAMFELVVSLKDEATYHRLGKRPEEHYAALRAVIRDGMERMSEELGVRDLRWAAAIHLNTDRPHVHIVIAQDCVDRETGREKTLEDIPRDWKYSKDDTPSRAASYFEAGLKERWLPLPPASVRTKTDYNTELPPRARQDLLGKGDESAALSYLLGEREISPAVVQHAVSNGSLYASQSSYCVFVHRDAEGKATGYTMRGRSTEDGGNFYVGNLNTATRYIFVDNPVEALSLFDLSKERDLAEACFVALDNRAPSDSLLRLIADRPAGTRVVWALGLDESGQQNVRHFEETRARLGELRAEGENEVVSYKPKAALGRSWNEQLVQAHLRGELETIESRAERGGQAAEPARVEPAAEVAAAAEEPTPVAGAEAVEPSAEPRAQGEGRTVEEVLRLIGFVETREPEPEILDGTRAFRMREAERVAARARQEEEVRELAAAQPAKNGKQPARVETDILRRIPLDQVLHAHGLRLVEYKGEKVYVDSAENFSIKVTRDLFSDRKDSMQGGRGAIDLVMHLQGVSFSDAKKWLTESFYGGGTATLKERPAIKEKPDEPKPLQLHPASDAHLNRVRAYLIETRGLDPALVEGCIANGTLYANSMGSAVFVHRDAEGRITGAEWRASVSNLRGTAKGTEKRFGWFYVGNMKTATRFVFVEAPIDDLSYIQLHRGGDVEGTCYVSLNGAAAQRTLLEFIAARGVEAGAAEIVWALDNNPEGKKSREAAEKSFTRALEMLSEIEGGSTVSVVREEPLLKDWNEEVVALKDAAETDRVAEGEGRPQPYAENPLPDELYRGTEPGDAVSTLRVFEEGELGRGIYVTGERWLAETYGGGPEAKVKDGTRFVHAYEWTRYPTSDEVGYLQGGAREGTDAVLLSGRGVELWRGRWSGLKSEAQAGVRGEINEAAAKAGLKVLVGLPDSVAINQISILDAELVRPLHEYQYYKVVAKRPVTRGGPPRTVFFDQRATEASSSPKRGGFWMPSGGSSYATAAEAEGAAAQFGLKDCHVRAFISNEPVALYGREAAAAVEQGLSALSVEQLVERIERAADFSYDDEAAELENRLAADGRSWRWTAQYAEVGQPRRVEIFDLQNVEVSDDAGRSVEADREGAGEDARVQGGLGREGEGLLIGASPEGVRPAGGVERVGGQGQFDGGLGRADAAEPVGARDGVGRGSEGDGGTDAQGRAGGGELRGGGSGGEAGVSSRGLAGHDAVGVEVSYARVVLPQSSLSSQSYREVQRACEAQGLSLKNYYISGSRESIEAAWRMLESIESKASIELIADANEKHLARTTGLREWELSLDDYVLRRHLNNLKSFESCITRARKELDELSPRQNKKRGELETDIALWERVLENPDRELEGHRKEYTRTYEATVKAAISRGITVAPEIIAQNPEFETASSARARYDKGRRTSFGNSTGEVNDSMREERGYKVKRQDGKTPTGAHLEEIGAGLDEIERVVGSVRDILHARDVSFVHTNGKRVFMKAEAVGIYHPDELTISTGTRSKLTGRHLPSQAHEFWHFLDDQAGAAEGKTVAVFTGARTRRSVVRYLSELDNQGHGETGDSNLIRDARAKMIYSREVERVLVGRADDGTRETQIAREYLSFRLGREYRQSAEISARLFEQYVATKLKGAGVWSVETDYTNTFGYWKEEDFQQFIPRIEDEIKRRLSMVREAISREQQAPAAEAAQPEQAEVRAAVTAQQAEPALECDYHLWLRSKGIDPTINQTLGTSARLRLQYLAQRDPSKAPSLTSENADEAFRARLEKSLPEAKGVFDDFGRTVNEVSVRAKQTLRGIVESLDSLDRKENAALRAQAEARAQEAVQEPSAGGGSLRGVISEWASADVRTADDGLSESQRVFAAIMEALPAGTSFELDGAGLNGFKGTWAKVEQQGAGVWQECVGGQVRPGVEFYGYGVGALRADRNTLLALVEEADGGIEVIELSSVEALHAGAEARPVEPSEQSARPEAEAAPVVLTEDERHEEATERLAARDILQSLRDGDLLIEADGHAWKVTSLYSDRIYPAGQLAPYDGRRGFILLKSNTGEYISNDAELFAATCRVVRGEPRETDKVRPEVLRHVVFHLARLEEADARLVEAQASDERAGGSGEAAAKVWARHRAECLESRAALTTFITDSMQGSVDGSKVLSELGGVPETVKARMMSEDVDTPVYEQAATTGRLVIDGVSVRAAREGREPQVDRQGFDREGWPEVVYESFNNSRYASEEGSPYDMLDAALHEQLSRRDYIREAEQALRDKINPLTGQEFTSTARTGTERGLAQELSLYRATFEEVEAAMGRACGDALRHRVEGRNREEMLAAYQEEFAKNERVGEIVAAGLRNNDRQNTAIALKDFVTKQIHSTFVNETLPNEPSPVEVNEYNIANDPAFFERLAGELYERIAPSLEAARTEREAEPAEGEAEGVSFLRVVGGVSEPSANYAGFDWQQMSDDARLWFGPAEHAEWIKGKLESGGYTVEFVTEETFRTLTDQLDEECYDRLGWPAIDWRRFVESNYYYTSEEPDPYQTLQVTQEEQEARTRAIIAGEIALAKNINPATGMRFRGKERGKFEGTVRSEREIYESLFEQIGSIMGDEAEAELRRRVFANVGELPSAEEIARGEGIAPLLFGEAATGDSGNAEQQDLFSVLAAPEPAEDEVEDLSPRWLRVTGRVDGEEGTPTAKNAVGGWKALNGDATLWEGSARNLAWQMSHLRDCGFFVKEVGKEEVNAVRAEAVTVFRSGVTAVTDLRAYTNANSAVGVAVGKLTNPGIDILAEHNARGGRSFVDNNAFSAFMHGRTVDFERVLEGFDKVLARMENKEAVSLVMPDVVGDQARSIELVREHREAILRYVGSGADVIIPIQKGEKSLSEAYSEVVEILGTNNFRVAIPSNQKAVSREELSAFLSESRPSRIHLLGISEANRRFAPLVGAVYDANPDCDVSADANRLRAIVGRNRPLTNAVSAGIEEASHSAAWEGNKSLGMVDDETEALYSLYNEPCYFDRAQAEGFAAFLTDDPEQRRRIVEAATDPNPPAASDAITDEMDELYRREYGSRLGYVLDEMYPDDRMYREVVFLARQQFAREAIVETDMPAAFREEAIERIERGARGKGAKPEAEAEGRDEDAYFAELGEPGAAERPRGQSRRGSSRGAGSRTRGTAEGELFTEPEGVGPHAQHLAEKLGGIRTHERLRSFVAHEQLDGEDFEHKRFNDLEKSHVREALNARARLIDEHGGKIPNNPNPAWGEHGIMRVTVGDGLPVMVKYDPHGIIPMSFHGPISSTGFRSGVPFEVKAAGVNSPLELAQAGADQLHAELLRENAKNSRLKKNRDRVVDLGTISLEAQYAKALADLDEPLEHWRGYARARIEDLEEVLPEKRGQADEAVRRSLDHAHQISVLDASPKVSSTIETIEQQGEVNRYDGSRWIVTFKDGRFPVTVRAKTELTARERAIDERGQLEAHGDSIDGEGFYVKGVEELPVPLPDGCVASITVLIVKDEIDGRWHYGARSVIRGEESNYPPHVFGGSNHSRHYAVENFHSYGLRDLAGMDEELAPVVRDGFNQLLKTLPEYEQPKAAAGPAPAGEAGAKPPEGEKASPAPATAQEQATEPPAAPEGWTLHSSTANKKTSYDYRSERFTGYRIALYNDGGRWSAEILTRQQSGGRQSWEPARNQYNGAVGDVVREAERRGLYWEEREGKKKSKSAAEAEEVAETNTRDEARAKDVVVVAPVVELEGIEVGTRLFINGKDGEHIFEVEVNDVRDGRDGVTARLVRTLTTQPNDAEAYEHFLGAFGQVGRAEDFQFQIRLTSADARHLAPVEAAVPALTISVDESVEVRDVNTQAVATGEQSEETERGAVLERARETFGRWYRGLDTADAGAEAAFFEEALDEVREYPERLADVLARTVEYIGAENLDDAAEFIELSEAARLAGFEETAQAREVTLERGASWEAVTAAGLGEGYEDWSERELTLIRLDGEPVGFLSQNEHGELEVIEILEHEQRTGVGRAALAQLYGQDSFRVHTRTDEISRSEALRGLLAKFGTVSEVDSRTLHVKSPAEAKAEELAAVEAIAAKSASRQNRGDNYVIKDAGIHDAGVKTRFKWNVEAVETLKLIEAEGRKATEEEKEILARFSGWGSMPGAFNKYAQDAGDWNRERDIIAKLLTAEEYEAAARSTLNAHYTHPHVADMMWAAVERMGFEGGRVCEPALGSGVFFGRIPENLRDRVRLTGVELDDLTGRIARQLYPNADIHIRGYQEFNPPDGWFDLTISNVPFGDYSVHDPEYNKYNASIHDYFFLKALDKTRDGGLVVMISSMHTMDKQNDRIRAKLAERADLVASFRLPNSAFRKNAGTEVVTDVIILQKRAPVERTLADAERERARAEEKSAAAHLKLTRASSPEMFLQTVWEKCAADAREADEELERAEARVAKLKEDPTNGVRWTKVVPVDDPLGGEPIQTNEYFAENPERIIGTMDRSGTMYRAGNVTVHLEEGRELEEELAYCLRRVKAGIYREQEEAAKPEEDERIVVDETSVKRGGYVVEGNKVFQRRGSKLVECEADDATAKRTRKLLNVRDLVRSIIDAELRGDLDAADASRRGLNHEYDRFVALHGPINVPRNQKCLEGDPDLHLLLALENDYTPKTAKRAARATKADIFFKPTLRSYVVPTHAENITEALGITLNEHGRFQMGRVCELLDKEPEEVGRMLVSEGLAFENPRSKEWETKETYLSGNVKAKLRDAEEAAREDERYAPNVVALSAVIPKAVDPYDIGVRIGAGWIPPEDIAEFAAHLVGGTASDFDVKYSRSTGSWAIGYTKEGAAKHRFKPAAIQIWGTGRADIIEVLQHALDSRAIIVRDRIEKDQYVVNKEETEAANSKLSDVKREFKEWIWTDPARRTRLHRYYNDNFNNLAPKKYDGSHLTFPGMATEIDGKPFSLRQHQRDAIWRGITDGRAILAHEVGTGKTYTQIAIAMERKRLGLSEKPAIVCLKANIKQITEDARKLYPGARILSTLGHFEKKDRRNLVAKIATGDWDLVILTHDNIDMLPMRPETRAKYIKEEMKELEDTIAAAEMSQSGRRGNRLVKSLEKYKLRLEEEMLEILDKRKDDVVNFEETGIDFLCVDEAHKYKSLKVLTRQDNVKGIPSTRSDRATNMLARVRWLQEQHNGQGIVFSTGTPIANTTAELFNLHRYMLWEELSERGVRSFDAWAAWCGETVTKIERTATGAYKEVTRFAKYTNLPELIQFTHQVMDVKLARDLPEIKRPRVVDEVIKCELTEEQREYQRSLQRRAEKLKGTYIREKGADNMLAISNDARKMSLDLRLVMPGAADNPNNKVNECVRDVLENYRQHPDVTQLIFSDLGVHENDWGFSVYGDITAKLIAAGIRPDQIIDFSRLTEKQIEEGVAKLKSGEANFAIGSTDKLGTGRNVQDHLYANHDLDVPWLPAYVLQRRGRIERQGNKHMELGEPVKVKRYVSVGGFDEIMWTAVDRKISFIDTIMQGNVNGRREIVEVDAEELTPAQIAAIASGDPNVLRKVELEDAIGEMERGERRHNQAQLRIEGEFAEIDERVAFHTKAIEELTRDREAYVKATTGEDGKKVEEFSAEIRGRQFDKRKAAGEMLDAYLSKGRDGEVLGNYKGCALVCHTRYQWQQNHYDLFLRGESGREYEVSYSTPEGIFASADATLRGLSSRIAANEDQIAVLEINRTKLKEQIGKPFRDKEELTAARAELVEVLKKLKESGQEKKQVNLKDGYLTLEEGQHQVHLTNAGVVKDLRPLSRNGGTLIKIDGEAVGWMRKNEEGALTALEIKEEYRRQGVATRVVEKVYGEKEFSSLVSTEDGRAFLNAVGTVEEGEEGLVTVKPHPRPARAEEEPTVEPEMLAEGDADGDTLVARRAGAQLREQLEALREVGLAELAERMEFDQDGARLHVNAEAGEVLRRAYEQISAQSGGKPVEVFSGKFSGAETVAQLVEVLDDTEAGLRGTPETQAQADRVGELTKAVRSVAEAGNKTVVIYLEESAIPHENLHRGAYFASGGASLLARHDLYNTLVESRPFRAAETQLAEDYRTRDRALLVEELACICADSLEEGSDPEELKRYNLSREQAAEYLHLWFESIARKNGDLSREEFRELSEESARIRDAAYDEVDSDPVRARHSNYGGLKYDLSLQMFRSRTPKGAGVVVDQYGARDSEIIEILASVANSGEGARVGWTKEESDGYLEKWSQSITARGRLTTKEALNEADRIRGEYEGRHGKLRAPGAASQGAQPEVASSDAANLEGGRQGLPVEQGEGVGREEPARAAEPDGRVGAEQQQRDDAPAVGAEAAREEVAEAAPAPEDAPAPSSSNDTAGVEPEVVLEIEAVPAAEEVAAQAEEVETPGAEEAAPPAEAATEPEPARPRRSADVRTDDGALLVTGFQTRVAVSQGEAALRRYPEIEAIATEGFRRVSGGELSEQGRAVLGEMVVECAKQKPTEEQEEAIARLMERDGLKERPAIIENQVDAAAWIARRVPAEPEGSIWTKAAIVAEESARSQGELQTDVGKFHRGRGANRSYGVSLALDEPISRATTRGREAVDVKYVAIEPGKIFDPHGLIPGTNNDQCRDDADALAARMVAADGGTLSPDGHRPAQPAESDSKKRTRILQELGYEAEARPMDGDRESGSRELVVFDYQQLRTVDRDLTPEQALARNSEWAGAAEAAHHEELERPDRLASATEFTARLNYNHADFMLRSAVEQTDLRRYVVEFEGTPRRISVRDVENLCKARALRATALAIDEAAQAQQGLPPGERKSTRVLRLELLEENYERELSAHTETVKELRDKHEEVIVKLRGERAGAEGAYIQAVAEASEVAERRGALPTPILTAKALTDLHNDAVDRKDPAAVLRVDELRQRLIAEYGQRAERNDRAAARLAGQRSMSELDERVARRNRDSFEESYHLRRFALEEYDRNEFLPEQRGKGKNEHERPEKEWSLKDVAKARQLAGHNKMWLERNAAFYDKQSSVVNFVNTHLSPMTHVRAEMQIFTDPKAYIKFHLDPVQQMMSNPLMRGVRFVAEYAEAKRQATECRRLADLEEKKLELLDDVEVKVREQIEGKREELNKEVAERTDFRESLDKVSDNEATNRAARGDSMPKPRFEQHEIRRMDAHAMELRDAEVLKLYESEAAAAKAAGMLQEESLPERAIGREITAEARMIEAERRLAALDRPLGNAVAQAAAEEAVQLKVRDVTLVRANVEGVERVVSLHDVAEAPEEVREAVTRALEEHEACLSRQVAEARDFHAEVKGIADAHRFELAEKGVLDFKPQFNVKEHLGIEKFAAGVEDAELNHRFSDIAQTALDNGQVTGIARSHTLPAAGLSEGLDVPEGFSTTDALGATLDGDGLAPNGSAFNALARNANASIAEAPQPGATAPGMQPGAQTPPDVANVTPDGGPTPPPSQQGPGGGAAEPTGSASQTAEIAEAAEVAEAAEAASEAIIIL